MSNYIKFQSTHCSNYGTSITVAKNHLILENEESLAIVDLNKIDSSKLHELEDLDIRSKPINLGDLVAEYDNRGEPYINGVTLTIDKTSVFLDSRDITDFINEVKNNA